ncbi:hypothetical protein [Desulfuribacillus alkaliarsenatis]|uniref:Uncharacterized protein n=1 Tax=Desulfuribacillus alkaliarsenatis TaxID=766136 RepID=A0A1E5G095_9FIRM|nr:hypothetical protein [Desulfuribacillus alkaliarsenatis]OEF96119.1 hypothetical protein BHF68_10330 [Desulfuribacillus alkaliarsenatis]
MNSKTVMYMLVFSIIFLFLITLNLNMNLKTAEQAHKKELAYHFNEIGWEFTKASEMLAVYHGDLSPLEKELFNKAYLSHISTIMQSNDRIVRNQWKSIPDNYSLSIVDYQGEDSLIYFMNSFNDNLNEENAKLLSEFCYEVGKMFYNLSTEEFDVFFSGDYKYILEEMFIDIHDEIDLLKYELEN